MIYLKKLINNTVSYIYLIRRKITFIFNYFKSDEQYAKDLGVKIGENCCIYSRNFGSEPYLITIGNNVQITDNVCFFTHGGGWLLRKEITNFDIFGKIEIKDNVYIGSGSYIMPGVTIESNVIIAARSVVTKSIPQNVIVAGNPAKIIGSLNEFKEKYLRYNTNTKNMTYNEKRKILLALEENQFIKKPFLHLPND